MRLNRKRQKIYIYEHRRSSWNPWTEWPVEIRELWCYCCRYMQYQPVPEEARFAEHPQQWGHIHWPEEMDTESRTAP
ncbi:MULTISPECIES: DUF6708 domain-containing protein [Citrobacter]|uniref:DUF6708 domain-containing protein n=1 Tax=Citrobacter meridianamericanus TaxID=2894201 RepID=A0ABT1B6L5_9ENTR|nr:MULTISPECIES: DUF6708 domain-containing protein [Citrobacter]MCO5781486.1 hypothetical protein [Citrobacter meridianamericanus]MDM2742785.1 hypothetical protein [Citrobacter sp. Cu096]